MTALRRAAEILREEAGQILPPRSTEMLALAEELEGMGKDAANVDDLAMMIRKLVRALKKVDPRSDLPQRAMDFLARHGLQGSPLRAAMSDPPSAITVREGE